MKNKTSLDIFFRTFAQYPLDQVGLNAFALADAAQDHRFLKDLNYLKIQCLLKEATGEKAKKISPHLIALSNDFNAPEWGWVERYVAGSPNMTIIVTSLNFDSLYHHLRQFLEIKFDSGLEMMLAFWDPFILATLVGQDKDKTLYVDGPVLDQKQREDFLKPIQSWWYWDRLEHLHAIFGTNESIHAFPYSEQGLHFSEEQEEMMVEATFPDNLIYYLKLNNSFLVDKFDDYELYQFVISAIPEARNYGLNGTRDILNFICLKLIYKENFLQDMKLQFVLKKIKDKQITMDDAMQTLMSKAS